MIQLIDHISSLMALMIANGTMGCQVIPCYITLPPPVIQLTIGYVIGTDLSYAPTNYVIIMY